MTLTSQKRQVLMIHIIQWHHLINFCITFLGTNIVAATAAAPGMHLMACSYN